MAKKIELPTITLDEVKKKQIRIVKYLLFSGALGYILSAYVLKNEALSVVLTPAINYILYTINEELKGEGVVSVIKNR